MSDAQRQPARAIADALALSGASVAFGLPGGGPNLDVVGALAANDIDFVLAHTETAACIMASTWGLLTDNVTAVVVTRGPGAASAVNGAAQATLDRHPLLIVTDTVPSGQRDRVPHQRIDQQAMFAPVSKATAVLGHDGTAAHVHAAMNLATAWPPGAVHFDYDASAASSPVILPVAAGEADPTMLIKASELVSRSRRPVVIVGVGAVDAAETMRSALHTFGAPVLSTYQAVGVVDTNEPIHAGLFTNGASERPLLDQADLIVTIGLDLVEPIPAPWAYDVPVVSVSTEPTIAPYLPITAEVIAPVSAVGDVASMLLTPTHDWQDNSGQTHNQWVHNRLVSEPTTNVFRPVDLVAALAGATPQTATVTVDAGAHFLAIMPLWPVQRPRQLLISNGLATMGFAVPAAIGAAIARPGEPVVALTGDGGLGMCLAELETIVRLKLPIVVVVFNDAALSLIEIKQQDDHGGGAAVHYTPTNFAAAAESMGMTGIVASTASDVVAALDAHDHASPLLIDARVDPASYSHLMRVTRG